MERKKSNHPSTNRRDLGFFIRKVKVENTERISELMNMVRVLKKARGSHIWKYVAAETSDVSTIRVISGSSRYELIPWWDRVICGATKSEMEADRVERRRLALLNSNLDVLIGAHTGKISRIENRVRSILEQIVAGLKEIQTQCGCAHGNLIPSNLVLEPHDEMNEIVRLRLQDFGFDPQIETSTFEFFSPEILLNKDEMKSSAACDMWSCGVLVLTLLGSRLLKRTESSEKTEIVRSYCKSLKRACCDGNENPSLADVWLDADLRRAITFDLCSVIKTLLYIQADSRSVLSVPETMSHGSVQDTKTGLPLKSPAPPATPQKTTKSDVIDVTRNIEETPLVRENLQSIPQKQEKTPMKTMSASSAAPAQQLSGTTLRCEILENEKSCLRATLEGNVLAPFFSIDTQVASWQELYGLFREKCTTRETNGKEDMNRGKNRRYVSLASTWDDMLRDNSSRSKSRRAVRRALAALPWSRPILYNACGGTLISTKEKVSFMYANTKTLRPVDIPYSLRRRVWCALLDVGSNVVSRDEDSVSTSAMRERYASLLCRAEQLGIDCEEQVVKDVTRCHQYIHLTQMEMMRSAVTRLVRAWIVEGKCGTRGYYQGLSSICVVFLVLFDMDEASTFACLCVFLERYLLRPCTIPTRNPASSRSPSRSPTRRKTRDLKTPEKRSRDPRTPEKKTSVVVTELFTPPKHQEKVLLEERSNNWWDAQDRALKFRLSRIAKLVGFHDAVLASRLERIQLRPDMFGLRYLLSMFAHTLPIRPLLVLWDAILTREHPSYVLFVTAAFVILQCEFQDDDDDELDVATLSTMMHQLSNLTGPKLTMVRRALDVADELWGSTPIHCLTVPGKDEVKFETTPNVWTKPLYIPIISALEIEKSVLLCVGPRTCLETFSRTYESVTIEAEMFQLCLSTYDLSRFSSAAPLINNNVEHEDEKKDETLEEKERVKRNVRRLVQFLQTHQDRWSSSDGAELPPLVTLIPMVSGLDEDRIVDAALRTEKSCRDLAQCLIRKGVNNVLVSDTFRGDEKGEVVTTNWHTGIVMMELHGVFD